METRTITITVDEVSAEIVMNILRYYNLPLLKEGERKDPFKDNSPYIKAIENVLKAYDETAGK